MRNSLKTYLLISTVGLGLSSGVLAQNDVDSEGSKAAIKFEKVEDYSDVRPSNESRKRFRDRVIKTITSHFNELADNLPAGQTLEVTVTDIDLAGRVMPASFTGLGRGANDVRLVQDVDIPRMEFSYSLRDSSGKVLKTEQVKLKDMGFLQSNGLRYNNDFLRYEKIMLDDWFEDTFDTSKS